MPKSRFTIPLIILLVLMPIIMMEYYYHFWQDRDRSGFYGLFIVITTIMIEAVITVLIARAEKMDINN
jgi:uncharacterized membrane protein YhaH (DUF805 family)